MIKTKMHSAMLAAFMLATASVSSITASAAEKVFVGAPMWMATRGLLFSVEKVHFCGLGAQCWMAKYQ